MKNHVYHYPRVYGVGYGKVFQDRSGFLGKRRQRRRTRRRLQKASRRANRR